MIGVLGLACAFGVSGAAAGCSTSDEEPGAPARACGLTVWHRPASAAAHVEIVGDWDGWRRPGTIPEPARDGFRAMTFDVPPGEHAYAIGEDGVWSPDRQVPMTAFHEGREVSFVEVADCGVPALRIDAVTADPSGHAVVEATFLRARGGATLDPSRVSFAPLGPADGAPASGGAAGSQATLRVEAADPERGAVRLVVDHLARGKHRFLLGGAARDGAAAESAIVTVWIEPHRWEPRDAIVYQVVLDRFRSEAGPLAAPARPSDRAGGTLAGLRRAIEEGEIEALGVDTLWLSPLYKNPDGDFAGNDGRAYTSYHGYWPIASRELDPRVATDAELERFMDVAHARGLRVLFDVVPNHVHEQHPWARSRPELFAHDCLCGQGTCDWASHIKTCAFAPYLPDLDWSRPDVAREATADAVWWLDRWGADGLRIDAVPMMPRAAVRRIAHAARDRHEHPGNPLYVLGENFTGPGGEASLRYDLGPFGLDGSFHFPLMWALRQAVAEERGTMADVDVTFRAGEKAWDGAGAVMGMMIGNHDVSRFASVSAGSASGDAWTPAPQPVDPLVYAKQRLALATVLTLPGAPVLYYGDEVGLAGRNDPDSRKVMPSEASLQPAQRETRDLVRRLGRARACTTALRRGALRTLAAEPERLVFAREVAGDVEGAAIVALGRRPKVPLELPLPPSAPRAFVDLATGERLEAPSGVLVIPADAFAAHVYVGAESPCAAAPTFSRPSGVTQP